MSGSPTLQGREHVSLAQELAAAIDRRHTGPSDADVQMRRAAWLLRDQEERLRIADVWRGVHVEQRDRARKTIAFLSRLIPVSVRTVTPGAVL